MVAFNTDGPERSPVRTALTDDDYAEGSYLGLHTTESASIWLYRDNRLVWVTGDFPPNVGFSHSEAGERIIGSPHLTLREFLDGHERFGPEVAIQRMKLMPKQFHPRIARPAPHHNLVPPGELPLLQEQRDPLFLSLDQLRTIVLRLEKILSVVHPHAENFGVYGNTIRDLLFLCCTECEAQWKGILKANNYAGQPRNWNRGDYQKLATPMRLNEYVISLAKFPWLGTFRPFSAWASDNLAKPQGERDKLEWFDNYNAVKHDREQEIARGNLKSVIEAVCATWVMMISQFGFAGMRENSDLHRFFHFYEGPSWQLSEAYFAPGRTTAGWNPVAL